MTHGVCLPMGDIQARGLRVFRAAGSLGVCLPMGDIQARELRVFG
jgi:hypothetical protein